jgi:hypothetical protein
MYEDGLLFYHQGHKLRILDLHRSAIHEVAVDITVLLRSAIQDSKSWSKYQFKLLHYSHEIISCLFIQHPAETCTPESVLVAFNPWKGQIHTAKSLESTTKLFVRNNRDFLYYGTRSERSPVGDYLWVIRGFDLALGKWLEEALVIPKIMGADLGMDVWFGILDGYFYGISSYSSPGSPKPDYGSYYTCVRFPLSHDGLSHLETAPKRRCWRRDEKEGPIDNRWNFLTLFQDEGTGQLKALEVRREWLWGQPHCRRIAYTSVIDFDAANTLDESDEPQVEHDITADSPEHSYTELYDPDPGQLGTGSLLLPKRDPHQVHPDADDSTFGIILRSCPVRAYHPSCQTYIDVLDTSEMRSVADSPRIRLRGCSRRLRKPNEIEQTKLTSTILHSDTQNDTFWKPFDDIYKQESHFWPPEPNKTVCDPALDTLYAILNPPGSGYKMYGAWDDRSIIYATGKENDVQLPLVFVSFDPKIYLSGTALYPGNISGIGIGSSAPSTPRGPDKGKNNYHLEDGTIKKHTDLTPRTFPKVTSSPCKVPWVSFVPASYLGISRGYHFAALSRTECKAQQQRPNLYHG